MMSPSRAADPFGQTEERGTADARNPAGAFPSSGLSVAKNQTGSPPSGYGAAVWAPACPHLRPVRVATALLSLSLDATWRRRCRHPHVSAVCSDDEPSLDHSGDDVEAETVSTLRQPNRTHARST